MSEPRVRCPDPARPLLVTGQAVPRSLTHGLNRAGPGHPGLIDNPSTDHLGSLIYDFDVERKKKIHFSLYSLLIIYSNTNKCIQNIIQFLCYKYYRPFGCVN